jgi:NAD+ synthase
MKTEKVATHIISWLKDYAEKSNIKGFVIGVSGGIDSALTSTLCAKTGFPTLCVEMPIHQAQSHVTRAEDHIKQLKVRYNNVSEVRVDLTGMYEGLKSVVPQLPNTPKEELSLANTRARLRMTTLYYFAGLHSYVVAGTGNKVEDFGVGFYTKYGDGGVDLSPIADLMKSEVYELAAYLKVPNSIQIAKPTDGLFGDNRTDEDQIGASYDELEWAMKEQDAGKNEADFSGRNQEVFKIYENMHKLNQHKMLPIPVCEIPAALK